MFDNRWMRILSYIAAGSATVAISEVVYYAYCVIQGRRSKRGQYAPLLEEVLWTNEMTELCKCSWDRKSANCKNDFCGKKNTGRLVQYINNAKYTIDLCMYTFTSYELAQALCNAHERGVNIRIISDKEMAYSTGSQVLILTKENIPARCPTGLALMHHKFVIFDGPTRANKVLGAKRRIYDKSNVRGVLCNGSLNWTMQGFGANFENIFITNSLTAVELYEKEYERIWLTLNKKFLTAKNQKHPNKNATDA